VDDVNSGRAYIKTWKEKVRIGSNEMLLPIIWYMDSAVTGQYDQLPLTALQFTIGILKKETRDKPWAWRSVGYVPKLRSEESDGNELFANSGHMDALRSSLRRGLEPDDDSISDMSQSGTDSSNSSDALEDRTGLPAGVRLPQVNAKTRQTQQDFHAIISFILHGCGYIAMQDNGFDWRLQYKNTTTHVQFVMFTLMLKGDTQEHDKHCGKFGSRTGNVGCLCRYCCCPTEASDDPKASFPMKTPEMIRRAIQKQQWDKLNGWSQHAIKNAWYDVVFGSHNKRGIHGACPSEMLHGLLLGWFLYCRNTFFDQTGYDSRAASTVNALASRYGHMLQRQSDRDKSRTNFSKGISKGKLMAKEYSGLLLVLLVVLRSTKGRECLMTQRGAKDFFGTQEQVADWIMLLESLIQWEVWLRQPSMKTSEIHRAKRKHKFMMALFKKIVRRQEGMGLKITKFHVILHLVEDILDFGVPTVFDTGSNEMAHKQYKSSAKQTQKNAKYFEHQTAIRCIENLAAIFGCLEIEEKATPWMYHWNYGDCESQSSTKSNDCTSTVNNPNNDASSSSVYGDGSEKCSKSGVLQEKYSGTDSLEEDSSSGLDEVSCKVINTGTVFILELDEDYEGFYKYVPYKSRSKSSKKKTLYDPQLSTFIGTQVLENIPEWETIKGFSEHKRNGQIFRAHPNFLGKEWFDWVLIDWGPEWGTQPAHIWTFLDLNELPAGTNFIIGNTGMRLEKPGIYAVVESAYVNTNPNEIEQSTLLIPICKEVNNLLPLERKFYLVDVDTFEAPTCVVPDIGGEANAFFRLLPKKEWLSTFVSWLNAPYEEIEELDTEEEDDDDLDNSN
jgi:hypothetical protein